MSTMDDDAPAGTAQHPLVDGPPVTDDQPHVAEGDLPAVAEQESKLKLNLNVEISDVGPCKKHVRVMVPRSDIDAIFNVSIDELSISADVPGFRKGRVPKQLISKRFRRELADDVKQKILVESLEQLAEENDLDPINEPNIDIEDIEIPEQGDFEYEFDVEVRPEFKLPEYDSLTIERPVREVADEDIDEYLQNFLSQYGKSMSHDGPAQQGDYITIRVTFTHNGNPLREISELTVRLRPVLRFQDAEFDGFGEMMDGVSMGETRETECTISQGAASIEMREETVRAQFDVSQVKRMTLPELNREFLQGIGVESEEELRVEVSEILERQVTYQQRRDARSQVLDKITESANWELPEELVAKQVENAIHREILEMQQAGFTTQEIQARENKIRQESISTTRQAMKQHFVLDKVATNEGIEVTPSDIEGEIQLMAMQRGESPRRLRARLTKSGVLENLEAQIRERKAVDAILDRAVYEDVKMKSSTEHLVEAVDQSVCGTIPGAEVATEPSTDGSADDAK